MGGESGIRLELDGVHAVDAVQATGQSCGGRHAQAEDGCSRRKGGESGIDYGAFGASASLRQLGLGGESGIRTRGGRESTPDFESGTFGHSVTSPINFHPTTGVPRRYLSIGGGRGTRTLKGVNPAVFKTAALPIRTSPP